jgi:hypothetical protein
MSLSSIQGETEAVLVESKLQSANLDMENDELSVIIRRKNDQIKSLQNRITSLEIDLVRARGEL